MPIKISDDFRVHLPGSGVFSSRQADFRFVEALASKGDVKPPLELWKHCNFMNQVFSRNRSICLWLVESPTKEALRSLQARFPDSEAIGASAAGYFSPSIRAIESFWMLYAQLSAREPWNYETPWAMAGMSAKLPKPKGLKFGFWGRAWTVDHILKHHDQLNSIFIQVGMESGFGLRETLETDSLIFQEFPQLRPSDSNDTKP